MPLKAIIHQDSMEALQSIVGFMNASTGPKSLFSRKIITALLEKCSKCDYPEKEVKAFLSGFLATPLQTPKPDSRDNRFDQISEADNIFFWFMSIPSFPETIEVCGFVLACPTNGKTLFDCYVQGNIILSNEEHHFAFMESDGAWNGEGKIILFLSSYTEPPAGSTFELSNGNLYRHLDARNGLSDSFQGWLSRNQLNVEPQTVLVEGDMAVEASTIQRFTPEQEQITPQPKEVIPEPEQISLQPKQAIAEPERAYQTDEELVETINVLTQAFPQLKQTTPKPEFAPLHIALTYKGGKPLKRALAMKQGEQKVFSCFIRNDDEQSISFENYSGSWVCYKSTSTGELRICSGLANAKPFGKSAVIAIPAITEPGKYSLQIVLQPKSGAIPPVPIREFILQVISPLGSPAHSLSPGTEPAAKKRRV